MVRHLNGREIGFLEGIDALFNPIVKEMKGVDRSLGLPGVRLSRKSFSSGRNGSSPTQECCPLLVDLSHTSTATMTCCA